jgi:hypothetical protein
MEIKNKILIILILLVQTINISCTGFSKTGRNFIIAKAKEEAQKKQTMPIPNTIIKDVEPIIVDIDDVVTPNEAEIIEETLIKNEISPAKGNLIQVEGLVLKEVRELTIELETTSSQLDQITKMKNHVFQNWHYIFDPATGSDTWRSAEATISLKYKGKYSGDCDDYSILLASFARQIGLHSRVVAGYDNDDGHAFAEFQVDRNQLKSMYLNGFDYRQVNNGTFWISLDWFKGKDHKRFTRNAKVLYGI